MWRSIPIIELATIGMLLVGIARVCGQEAAEKDETPIYKVDPYDLVILTKENDSSILKVLPLNIPGRQIPESPMPRDRLRLTLFDRRNRVFELEWRHIEEITLFEGMVLDAAKKLIDQKKLDEAYDYLAFLVNEYPNTEGLRSTWENYLVADAFAAFQANRYADALFLLEDVRQVNPNRAELQRAVGRVFDRLISGHIAKGEFLAARKIMELAGQRHGDWQSRVLDSWRSKFQQQAQEKMDTARRYLLAGDYEKADKESRRIADIWPRLEGAQQLADEINQRYPIVVVGVTQPAVDEMDGFENWAARRTARLTGRTVFELTGVGSEGGRYECPLGQVEYDKVGRTLRISLAKTNVRGPYNGYQLAHQILNLANPDSETYDRVWAQFVSGVDVRAIFEVDTTLRRQHPRPEALLHAKLHGNAEFSKVGQPYIKPENGPGEVTFKSNNNYFARQAGQPSELVEIHMENAVRSIGALLRGDVDVLDRVFPADIDRLKQNDQLVVGTYRIPIVHMLVPNFQRPYLGERGIRRAIQYGIDREAILYGELLGGRSQPGFVVLTGPLPAGKDDNDPLSYAYDERIVPRPYDPTSAKVLLTLATRQVRAKAKGDIPELGELVLAFPAMDTAQIACESIARQLKLVGIKVSLRALADGHTSPADDNWDLLYVEVLMQEPIVDVLRVLASDGLIRNPSVYVDAALDKVSQATSWEQARNRLHALHRVAHDETIVISLWQTVVHFAHRSHVRGIGAEPVTLYQNVEQWRTVQLASES